MPVSIFFYNKYMAIFTQTLSQSIETSYNDALSALCITSRQKTGSKHPISWPIFGYLWP